MTIVFNLRTPTLLTSLPYRHLFKPSVRSYSSGNGFLANHLITQNHIRVRTMTKQDLECVMGWASKEGWNPGLFEVEALYAADSKGFNILEIDDRPVASLASIRYSSQFAFLGLYIVQPQYRKQGYGKLLWDIVMGNLHSCSTIGLNGVKEQVEQYEREGFKPVSTNTRWRGNLLGVTKSSTPHPIPITIQKPEFLAPLINYSARLFPAPRAPFLAQWLTMPQSHVLAAIENGEISGYGVISKTADGYKIAPLLANKQAIAEQLYLALCRCVGNQGSIYIDTPNNNPDAVNLMQHFGLERTFDTYRMYKGQIQPIDDSKWFGLNSLEIG